MYDNYGPSTVHLEIDRKVVCNEFFEKRRIINGKFDYERDMVEYALDLFYDKNRNICGKCFARLFRNR